MCKPEKNFESDIENFNDILLEGKPITEYQYISEKFNEFITLAAEGREINELTNAYEGLYCNIDELNLSPKKNNKLLYSIFEVATKAEMQGFIYGFLMSKRNGRGDAFG